MKVGCERSCVFFFILFLVVTPNTRLRPLTGKTKDGEQVSGSIKIPEVAHDTEEDEYVVCLLSLVCLWVKGVGFGTDNLANDHSLKSRSTLNPLLNSP